MNWKFLLVGIIICLIVIVTIMRRKIHFKPTDSLQQIPDSILENMSEELKFLITTSDKVFTRLKKIGFEGLGDAEKVFVCVWELEGQVNNGGFHQFFFNSSGEYSVEAVSAFEKIGATKMAGIIQRANTMFKDGRPPKNWESRQEELLKMPESATEEMERLTNEFYKYPDDVDKLLYQFVLKHREEFLDI